MNTSEKETTQCVYCTNCGMIFALCAAPWCYTDADWHRDVKRYVKKGYAVKTLTGKEEIKAILKEKFGKCKCPKPTKNLEQLNLLEATV